MTFNKLKLSWILIGTIVSAQGLQGEVRIYPDSDFPERFIKPGPRWLLHPGQTEPGPIELLRGRLIPGKGIYVIKFAGIDNRDQAEALKGCQLMIAAGDRPTLGPDEFYIPDLIGLSVYNHLNGTIIGTVVDFISVGNNLLEVELSSVISDIEQPNQQILTNLPKKVLIPFVNEIVPIVNLAEKRIEVKPIPGLLD